MALQKKMKRKGKMIDRGRRYSTGKKKGNLNKLRDKKLSAKGRMYGDGSYYDD